MLAYGWRHSSVNIHVYYVKDPGFNPQHHCGVHIFSLQRSMKKTRVKTDVYTFEGNRKQGDRCDYL
jgi:hypothetical protein